MDDESGVSDVGRGVPRMSATAPIERPGLTAEELFELPEDGLRHELIEGELRTMTPAGAQHGRVALRVGARILEHVEENGLGEAYGAETGFVLSRGPDTVRAPGRGLRGGEPAAAGAGAGVRPDRPRSRRRGGIPVDRASEVSSKAAMWLDAGVRLVWVVDPQARLAGVHHPGGLVTVLRADGVLDGVDVLPGFRLPLSTLFD